jgi:hypothetical protein
LHIGFDAVTGRIVASILTDRDVDDASQVEPLLDQIADPVELFLGDGGYDRTGVYTALVLLCHKPESGPIESIT